MRQSFQQKTVAPGSHRGFDAPVGNTGSTVQGLAGGHGFGGEKGRGKRGGAPGASDDAQQRRGLSALEEGGKRFLVFLW